MLRWAAACVVLVAACGSLGVAADGDIVVLTSGTFDEEIKTGQWLVEFYAPWCGHCKRLEPIYAEAARELAGRVRLAKVDATQERALAARFPLKGYPTMFFISDGEVREANVAHSRPALVDFASGGWENTAPLSYLSSPLGPVGVAKGRAFAALIAVTHLHQWLIETQGMSMVGATSLMFGVGMVGTLVVGVLAAWLCFPKLKDE